MALLDRLRTPVRRKRRAELAFWRERAQREGELAHFWYEQAFCEHFGLARSDYEGLRVLDVGCGPRGSLEWADMAARRVGLDPLADEYVKLNGRRHAMEYVAAPSERMPFDDGSFDVVATFNSLDHVEDLHATAAEMVRVLAPGGRLLLLVMVGHEPSEMEPHELSWDAVELFAPALSVERERRYEDTHDGSLYEALIAAKPYDEGDPRKRVAFLSALLRKGAS